jgi:hypothetical protein
MDLTDFYTFHPVTQNAHSCQCHMEHSFCVLFKGHKRSLNKLKKIEIVLTLLSDCNVTAVEINNEKLEGIRIHEN